MLFHVTHVHTNKDCPAGSPDTMRSFTEWWQGVKNAEGIKIISGYVSPVDHTFFITVEADDYLVLSRALGPIGPLGAGHTSPVVPMDAVFPTAE